MSMSKFIGVLGDFHKLYPNITYNLIESGGKTTENLILNDENYNIAADINFDNLINVVDIVNLVNIILTGYDERDTWQIINEDIITPKCAKSSSSKASKSIPASCKASLEPATAIGTARGSF